LRVVVRGYEAGADDISPPRLINVDLAVNEEECYGPHAIVDRGAPAVFLSCVRRDENGSRNDPSTSCSANVGTIAGIGSGVLGARRALLRPWPPRAKPHLGLLALFRSGQVWPPASALHPQATASRPLLTKVTSPRKNADLKCKSSDFVILR
jgi:hypothetical protein